MTRDTIHSLFFMVGLGLVAGGVAWVWHPGGACATVGAVLVGLVIYARAGQ